MIDENKNVFILREIVKLRNAVAHNTCVLAELDKKDNPNKPDYKIVYFLQNCGIGKEASEKWGGEKMVIAPPLEYNEIMKMVPSGKLLTTSEIRKYVAKKHNVDVTCPLTAGIFINICAWASYQREDDITPYWRILKTDGELNPKYPGGVEAQKQMLEKEGFKIGTKGNKNIKYFVKDYEKDLFELK